MRGSVMGMGMQHCYCAKQRNGQLFFCFVLETLQCDSTPAAAAAACCHASLSAQAPVLPAKPDNAEKFCAEKYVPFVV